MLASALKASRLSQVRNARGYASAAGKIGDKKVPMSPLEQDRFINYQVRILCYMLLSLASCRHSVSARFHGQTLADSLWF